MADESYNFTTARTRLEEIVTQVRKKDTSLEKSLDLLEEGVRLANACTELIDRADWAAAGAAAEGTTAGESVEAAGDAGDGSVTVEEATEEQAEGPVGDAVAADADVEPESAAWAGDTGTDASEAKDDTTGADESEAPEYDVVEDETAQER